jgi:hypothetical protein
MKNLPSEKLKLEIIETSSSLTFRQPRYSKVKFAQRGNVRYESQMRSQVETDNHGKIVAIDLETENFEVDKSEIVACVGEASQNETRLEARHPDA